MQCKFISMFMPISHKLTGFTLGAMMFVITTSRIAQGSTLSPIQCVAVYLSLWLKAGLNMELGLMLR
jgi:hypothetical protein